MMTAFQREKLMLLLAARFLGATVCNFAHVHGILTVFEFAFELAKTQVLPVQHIQQHHACGAGVLCVVLVCALLSCLSEWFLDSRHFLHSSLSTLQLLDMRVLAVA
jgi:hypothetical protein